MKHIAFNLEKCQNMFGYEIDNEIKDRVKAFFKNPCEDTWNDIFSIIINVDGKTIWAGWIELDPSAPKSARMDKDDCMKYSWERMPDRFLVYRIIKTFGGKK
jgi:hypothetical protein